MLLHPSGFGCTFLFNRNLTNFKMKKITHFSTVVLAKFKKKKKHKVECNLKLSPKPERGTCFGQIKKKKNHLSGNLTCFWANVLGQKFSCKKVSG